MGLSFRSSQFLSSFVYRNLIRHHYDYGHDPPIFSNARFPILIRLALDLSHIYLSLYFFRALCVIPFSYSFLSYLTHTCGTYIDMPGGGSVR